MSTDLLDCVVLDPPGQHTASVIWLHGLGASGNDFVPVVPYLGLPADHGVRFVFPHAPVRPVTLNMGMAMPAWYDIKSLSAEGREDAEGMRESSRAVEALIDREAGLGISHERIIIAGFSQGGAVALNTVLGYGQKLGGLIALSTYLALRSQLHETAAEANKALPILMAHGQYDATVQYSFGEMSKNLLVDAGYDVDWRIYPMQHEVVMEEIKDIGAYIQQRLA